MRGAWAPTALIVLAASLVLSACASTPSSKPGPVARADKPHGKPAERPPEHPAPETPPAGAPSRPPAPSPLTALPGWDAEDHLAALSAFQAGCGAARDAAMRALCGYARAIRKPDDASAKVFFEENFRAERVAETPGTAGVLTAYFAPEYEARDRADPEFSAPVRPRPSGAVMVAAAAPAPPAPPLAPVAASLPDLDDLIGVVLSETETVSEAKPEPPRPEPPRQIRVDLAAADRAVIERSPAADALAWMRPEDLFFLQIQGSGVLTFSDGRRMKAAYASDNGKPFVAIARPMVNQGLLKGAGASGDNIRGWLASHRGADADKVMQLNPRYVFFALTRDDDREPAGAAGIPLPAGRAIAIDPSRHSYGEVFWIDAEAPVLAGANKTYRRLAMALDTGAAIRGQVRADLYIGRGAGAGAEAGRVRHTLRMTRLVPLETVKGEAGLRGSARGETAASTGGG
jgi:membrane-bound lytic murein transglycosylase A